jgi:hypothetical protein
LNADEVSRLDFAAAADGQDLVLFKIFHITAELVTQFETLHFSLFEVHQQGLYMTSSVLACLISNSKLPLRIAIIIYRKKQSHKRSSPHPPPHKAQLLR